jgi:LemA protein
MWIMIGIVAVVLLSAVLMFNNLVRVKMLVGEAWSGIDVQLKRRYDLVPNVVETVKGYAQHERKVLEGVTEMRSRLMRGSDQKDRKELENGLAQGLKSIFALAEAYPDLKANKNFADFQKTLSEIEDQIQMARRYYNGTVRNYNTAIQVFPGNIIAGIFSFKPSEFFEIEYATQRETPDVKFTS